MTRGAPVRDVALEGCVNFRDLGGYRAADGRHVRHGLLYRSDSLHHLTPLDAAQLRAQLAIGTLIDLRSTAEIESEGRGILAKSPIAFHHVPLIDEDPSSAGGDARALADQLPFGDRYFLLARLASAQLARIVTILGDLDGAAVFYCAAGKDRTGIVAAMLLKLLGVDDRIVADDYALTRRALGAILARLARSEGYRAMLDALPPDTMTAEPATVLRFLANVSEHFGSMEGFVLDAGVAPAVLGRLRARLLE